MQQVNIFPYTEGFFVFCPALKKELTQAQIAERFDGDALTCKRCLRQDICLKIFRASNEEGDV